MTTMTRGSKMPGPDPIDKYVGSRIKMRRTLLSVSQEKLADALGITFQQVQKYENGANRVGASRLFHIAQTLDVPVSFFYEGYSEERSGRGALKAAEEQKELDNNVMTKKETIDLVKAYYSIDDDAIRRKVFEMMRSLAK